MSELGAILDEIDHYDEWTSELVRLANAYREARSRFFMERKDMAATYIAREALLEHAYNGGKAP